MKKVIRLSGILFFGFFSFTTIIAVAQNYEAIKTDASYYFYDSINQDIIVARIDSIAEVGNQTRYYGMRQIRPTDYSCYIPNGDSWLGYVVTGDPEGIFRFNVYPFSPPDSADVFTILSNSTIGQSWRFYNYHFFSNYGNQYIEAKVTQINLLNFLGLSDSVKTITLQQKDASGENVSNPINGQKILLSKNYGLIRLPKFDDLLYFNAFYDIVGKTNPEIGITNLKTMQIYDFEPGDEFHTVYQTWYFSNFNPETTISAIMKVLSKTLDSTGNSVTYELEQCQSGSYKLSDTITTVSYRFDTISQTYSTLLTPEFETDPLEPAESLSNNWTINPIMGLSTDPLFPFQEVPYKGIQSLEAYTFNSENCYMPIMLDGCPTLLYYFKGLGGPYFQCKGWGWGSSSNILKYYKKGIQTWGMPLNCDSLLHVGRNENPMIQNLKIYPNPTFGTIIVSISAEMQIPFKLEIFDISGRLTTVFKMIQQTQAFDLSNLPAGLYSYKLTSIVGEVFRGKIIRQ